MSDVSAMVERAAERIERGNYGGKDNHDICLSMARAALLAALDPEDEALVEALARVNCERCGVDPDHGYRGPGTLAWHDMRDAAQTDLSAIRALVSRSALSAMKDEG